MGYVLGNISLRNLDGVHPDLVRVVRAAIGKSGQDFRVNEGVRSREQQMENVAKGVSKTMHSKHLIQSDGYGHAVDLVPWLGGRMRWEWPLIYPIARAMREVGREMGVRLVWGGVWDQVLNDLSGDPIMEVARYTSRHPGPDFLDGPHYELAK
ncbi:MAG TPA: M15 family metallopeptidase [Nitrospira sp.]|nr:M15 family metallopeptidase [Nitrospira sp.]